MNKIAVFLGSRLPDNANLTYAVKDLGKRLAQAPFELVYGGSKAGLMGLLAREALLYDGFVTGIIPDDLLNQEFLFRGLSETIKVPTMQEAKKQMIEMADAFVAFPGGSGTINEIFEVIALNQLGVLNKPSIFINLDGFYDGIIKYIETATSEGIIDEKDAKRIYFTQSTYETIELLNQLLK